jgi:hypothetical protein
LVVLVAADTVRRTEANSNRLVGGIGLLLAFALAACTRTVFVEG